MGNRSINVIFLTYTDVQEHCYLSVIEISIRLSREFGVVVQYEDIARLCNTILEIMMVKY